MSKNISSFLCVLPGRVVPFFLILLFTLLTSCSVSTIVSKGKKKYHQQEYAKAKKKFEKALKKDSSRVDAWVGLGDCYYQIHNFEKAIESYENGFSIEKECKHDLEVLYLGNAYFQLDSLLRAKQQYDYIIVNCPYSHIIEEASCQSGEVGLRLAQREVNAGGYRQAVQYLTEVIGNWERCNSSRDKVKLYDLLGYAYLQLDKFQPSISAYQEAVRLDSYSTYLRSRLSEAYYLHSQYLFNEKKFDSVLLQLNQVDKRGETWSQERASHYYFMYGISLFYVGNYVESVSILQRALGDAWQGTEEEKEQIHLVIGRASLAYLKSASTFTRRDFGSYVDNVKTYTPDLASSSDFLQIEADYYFSNGKFELALEAFQKLEISNTSLSDLDHQRIALCYYKALEYEKANSHFNKVQAFQSITRFSKSECHWIRSDCSFLLGEESFKQDRLEESLKYFQEVIEHLQLDFLPGITYGYKRKNAIERIGESHYYRAQIYGKSDSLEESLQEYMAYLALYPEGQNVPDLYKNACTEAALTAELLRQYQIAIYVRERMFAWDISGENLVNLARLSLKLSKREAAIKYLFQGYSLAYEEYYYMTHWAHSHLADFSKLSADPRFIRWSNGIRRVKLVVDEASSTSGLFQRHDDLFVTVSAGNVLLLCTEAISNEMRGNYQRVYFENNTVVFDYKVGTEVKFDLYDLRDAWNSETEWRISHTTLLSIGDRVGWGDYSFHYYLYDTEEYPYSDNQSVPVGEDALFTYLIVGGLLFGPTRLISCFAQNNTGYVTDNPFYQAAIAEAISSIERDEMISFGGIITGTILNALSERLRVNGYDDIANLIEGGVLLNCLLED